MTTLCIVDMQPRFSSASHCLDAVCDQVKLAKKRKAGIIVLEFGDWGDTFSEIKNLLSSYKHVVFVEKNQMGGGQEFQKAAENANFNTKKVRFVGVDRGYCVFETIKEAIHYLDCQVEIVEKATWCCSPSAGLKKLRKIGKII